MSVDSERYSTARAWRGVPTRMQKALEGTDRLERAKAREHEFYEGVLRREDKKRALDDRGPEGMDERISPCDHSREIGGPARIPSQASRSSRLNDEDKKLGREQSRLREVKNHSRVSRRGSQAQEGRLRRRGTMVG